MLEIEYVHPKNFQNIIIFYYYYFSFLATIRRGLHRTQFSLLLAILSLFHFSSIFFFVFTVLFGAFNLRLAAVSVLGVCLFHCVRMNFDIFFFFGGDVVAIHRTPIPRRPSYALRGFEICIFLLFRFGYFLIRIEYSLNHKSMILIGLAERKKRKKKTKTQPTLD